MDQKNMIKIGSILNEMEPRLNMLIRVIPKETNKQFIAIQKKYFKDKTTEIIQLIKSSDNKIINPRDKEALSIADTMRGISKNPTLENLNAMKELCEGLREDMGIR